MTPEIRALIFILLGVLLIAGSDVLGQYFVRWVDRRTAKPTTSKKSVLTKALPNKQRTTLDPMFTVYQKEIALQYNKFQQGAANNLDWNRDYVDIYKTATDLMRDWNSGMLTTKELQVMFDALEVAFDELVKEEKQQ